MIKTKKISAEQLKTVSQVATEKGVSVTAIYNHVKEGRYNTIKIGKITFIID